MNNFPMLRWLVVAMAVLGFPGCATVEVAPDMVVRHGLQLQVNPYVAWMPRVVLENEEPACEDLIVPFSIRAGPLGFPPGLEVRSVSLMKLGAFDMVAPEVPRNTDTLADETRFAGHIVEATVRETYFVEPLTTATDWSGTRGLRPGEPLPPGMAKERVLRGVAVVCPPHGWESGDAIKVVLQLTAGAQRAMLRAKGHYWAGS